MGIHSGSAHRAAATLPDLAKVTEKQQIAAKAAAARAHAEAEFEGRLKARNDGSYEAFAKLNGSERRTVLSSQSEAYRDADTEARNWGTGGGKSRALNAGAALVTGQTGLQTAADTLAPYAARINVSGA